MTLSGTESGPFSARMARERVADDLISKRLLAWKQILAGNPPDNGGLQVGA